MIVLFPLLLLSLIAVCGRKAVAAEAIKTSRNISIAGALGGFAHGVVRTWLAAVAIRVVILFGITWADVSVLLFSPLLFAAELWVLLGFACAELFTMGGQFSAKTEWPLSRSDGTRKTIQLTLTSSVLFLLTWFLMAPGEYESYRPNLFTEWTPAKVRSVFPLDNHGSTAKQVALNGRTAAIPDAILAATCTATIGFILLGLINAFRRQLKMHYLEPEPRVTPPIPVGGRVPRGGELN